MLTDFLKLCHCWTQ